MFLDYLGSLLHIVGMLLLAGGHIWFGLFSASAERRRDHAGVRFLATMLPLMANTFGVGILLLFGSGVCKSRKQWKSFAHIPGGKKLT